MKTIAILGLSITGVLANWMPSTLSTRDVVKIPCNELGEKTCGDGCIPLSYTCCPDQAGGCPATAQCQLAENDKYGCCPLGKTCGGPGGASTDINTRTSTILIPGDTSTVTIPQGPTSTTQPTSTSKPTSASNPTSTSKAPSSSTTTYSATLPITTVSSRAPCQILNSTTYYCATLPITTVSSRAPCQVVNSTTYCATLPITTGSSRAPSLVPNATVTTQRPPVITAGAATHGLSASGLLGALLAGALAFLF
ncbi:GPI anchored serine-threonine rich protein [Tolypocladium paradoxum]|uniref:GPI anchored serine-threonine rich protein n=1 Tax=Tolypocladium paradoxum TaxID=94208 RepID=A0A2S4L3J2_9HYPO|nr:GPI anchored serine-threonine rich protein [Tolypocladium paradoxum]